MMFHGTYRSEFYRAIRDLLHDQVTTETLNAPSTLEAYEKARSVLERRWHALLAREPQYRTSTPLAAAAVT
jgi:anaerobic magnesium-protoporphyrin IX monomethyl ester cyclase